MSAGERRISSASAEQVGARNREKIAAADRNLATARAEIVVLRSTIDKLSNELAQMKAKADPHSKK